MRPLRLELEAFGSYPGKEVVDFTVLVRRGLFVVTGPTGTGKTTIFDAMCFALYGVMPRKGAGEARSHHADPGAPTVVRFDFESDGDRYTVTRSPEYERPAKRGGQTTTERAQAQLIRHHDDGTTTSVATKMRAVTDECTRLLGLGAEQFQRVVLLPQGEVARFLTASSDERADLLATLFGGAVYQGFVEELRQRSSELERLVADSSAALQATLDTAEQQVGRLVELLDEALVPTAGEPRADDGAADVVGSPSPDRRQRVGALLTSTEPGCQALTARAAALERAAGDAAQRHQFDQGAARRFDQHAEIRRRLAELDEEWPSVEAAARQAEVSASARPVVAAAEQVALSIRRRDEARTARESLQHDLDVAFAELGVEPAPRTITEMTQRVAAARADQDRRRASLEALTRAEATLELEVRRRDTLRAELARLDTEAEHATALVESLRARLDELAPSLVDVGALRARMATLDELADHRRTYDRLLRESIVATEAAAVATAEHAAVLARFVATEAPRLATQLVPGEPCAVCGSTEHPRPAAAGDTPPTSFDDVNAAADRRARREQERNRLEHELGAVVARLGDHRDSSLEQLAEQRNAVAAESATAEAAHAEHRSLMEALAELDEQIRQCQAARAGASGQLSEVEHAVGVRAAELDAARGAAGRIDVAELERIDNVVARLDRRCADVAGADEAVTAADATAAAAQRTLSETLAASPFSSVDEARAAVLDLADESRRLDVARRLSDELSAQHGALRTVIDQGVPDERPDVEASSHAAAAAADDARAASETATRAAALRDEVQRSLGEHDRRLGESGELRAAAAAAQRAHAVCAFGGPLRMSVRRWVLAQELDRVTAAANVHLARMTAGRYSLQRQVGVADKRRSSGLELEVLDAHTGRPRSTSSLSGGEQFQASLALALGLADVVSHGGDASGRVFEALFVDEGFGSLDQDALRDAIDTLHHLRATGRMVGAITHVDAMKQELHPGIEVRRRADGRGSTLVVNP